MKVKSTAMLVAAQMTFITVKRRPTAPCTVRLARIVSIGYKSGTFTLATWSATVSRKLASNMSKMSSVRVVCALVFGELILT